MPKQFVHIDKPDTMTTLERVTAYVERLKMGQPAHFKIHPGKTHGFLDSGCNEYNNGCFKELSEPAVSDMVNFLNEVFSL